MNELLNLKVEISNLDLKENTISDLLTSANKVQEEIEKLIKIINIKSDFIIDLLETIYCSDDTTLHTKAHLIGEEYEDKLKELKGEIKNEKN